jgi:hypothetical protein
MTPMRRPQGHRRAWRLAASRSPPEPSEASHIAELFADAVAAPDRGEGGRNTSAAHILAATERWPRERAVSLWVTDPALNLDPEERCFFLYADGPEPFVPFAAGWCGMDASQVTLRRFCFADLGDVVVGMAGALPARSVRVTTPAGSAEVPLISGYFLLPPSLSAVRPAPFHLVLVAPPAEVIRSLDVEA